MSADDPNNGLDEVSSSDALRERMRSEAISTRPAYSADFQGRIMDAVRAERGLSARRKQQQLWNSSLAVAAGIALIVGVSTVWLRVSPQTPKSPDRITAVNTVPKGRPVVSLAELPTSVEVGGFITAKVWPPEIAVRLPGVVPIRSNRSDAKTEVATAAQPVGLPEWILGKLDVPANKAQLALKEALPPGMRALLEPAQ